MRKILSSVLILTAGIVLLHSCEKMDIPQDVNTLGKGSYVTLEKENNLILDFSNLAGSKASIDVAQYGADQAKITIYVAPGVPNQDKTKWKMIKEVLNDNNGLYSLSVSGAEIAKAIAPAVIEPGNQYTMYNVITTKDGRTFDYANTSTAFSGIPNYRMALAWSATVVCPFAGPIGGTYIVDRDDWVDWNPGQEVAVTDGPGPNQVNISKVWPGADAGGIIINPLIIDVKAATGEATIPTGVVWGKYSPNGSQYSTGTPNTGFVFSCTGQIIMNIRINSSSAGDQGSFNLWLHKK